MSDFAAYTFYVNRPDLLVRAIKAFPDLIPELTVVNNSDKELCEVLSADDVVECCFRAHDVFKPPIPLTYSQSMNWILQDASTRDCKFLLHFHSDADSTNPTAVADLLACARADLAANRRRICWWTHYDILWAVNVEAALSIGGWDTMFPDYFTDNDFRRRAELAGWECHDTDIQGISHEGSATIRSNPRREFLNGQTFGHYSQIYHQKWGGGPGEEKFDVPFNRPDIFGEREPTQ